MSDSTTQLEQIDGDQASHEVTANGLFDACSIAAAYGRHAETCVGLTWGYYGARYGGTLVANGTNTCGASTTTYMVAAKAGGAVSFATATTNWNDATNYLRCFKIVTGPATVTSYEDHRFGPLGSLSASGSGMANPMTTAGDIIYGGASGTPTRLPKGTAGQAVRMNTGLTAPEWGNALQSIIVAASDEATALTTGVAKVTFRMPYAFTLVDVRASVDTAPTGGTLLTVDVNENGTTILSTKLTFDASEKSTTTAATPRVISDTSLADDSEMTIDIDAVGSTIAGAGLKVTLIGYPT